MASLRVVRASGPIDRLRAYKIVLDGKPIGTIRDGEVKQLQVAPGQHELSLRVDWCGSNVCQFSLGDSKEIAFHVRSNLRGSRHLSGIWYTFFARNSYLL